MVHQEKQEYLYHMSRDELIEHSISSEFLIPHNVNTQSDQIEYLEDVIIKYYFEFDPKWICLVDWKWWW